VNTLPEFACSVLGFACQSIFGPKTEDFWKALQAGIAPDSYHWPKKDSKISGIHPKLLETFAELKSNISNHPEISLAENSRLGVILASTKGDIDEYIWDQAKFHSHQHEDAMTPLLHRFLKAADLKPTLSLCVSNACASSLSAIFLAQRWLTQNRVDQVLVIAADSVGPFVEKGFISLQALSQSAPRPFSKDRDGLRLGEATAMVLLGKTASPLGLQIDAVGLDTEGYAVTRPSPTGASLTRASLALPAEIIPDLIIAHGTGTQVNDAAEDRSFYVLYGNEPAITGSKWAIGHTLGTSGLMDLIAAAFVIRDQNAFSLATTVTLDPSFQSRYLVKGSETKGDYRHVLISSLGFGGIHALGLISKVGKS
jgi:3-oxoacyl-[acyl-carrier-protein] synthase-1